MKQNMRTVLLNKATQITLDWIYHNKHELKFRKAMTIQELKAMVVNQLGGDLSLAFIDGARMTNWYLVFTAIGCFDWIPISKLFYTLMYIPSISSD